MGQTTKLYDWNDRKSLDYEQRTIGGETLAFADRIRKWYTMGQQAFDRQDSVDIMETRFQCTDQEWGGFLMGYNARKEAADRGLEPSVIGVETPRPEVL